MQVNNFLFSNTIPDRTRGRCTWSEFSDQKYSAILIFFPWKKTAGASLPPFTEALAGLQTQDTLKSTATQLCLPLTHSSTKHPVLHSLLQTFSNSSYLMTSYLLSLLSLHRCTKISLSRPLALLSQLLLICEMEFAAGCPISPSQYISHSCRKKVFIISRGFTVMSLKSNVR